jgi:hypothetical protein
LTWDNDSSSFEALMHEVAATPLDAMVLCGLATHHVSQLLREKVSVLGPHAGPVRTFAADAWVESWLLADAAHAANDLTLVAPGLRPGMFPQRGEAFIDAFREQYHLERERVEPYAVHAAQCVEVLLRAIAESDGTRSDVRDKLFSLRITGGVLGDFSLDASGEPAAAAASILGFTVYRVRHPTGPEIVGPLVPPAELIAAALG